MCTVIFIYMHTHPSTAHTQHKLRHMLTNVLYTHNLRNSMNEQIHFFIKIYLSLYSQKGWCFCGVWEMDGETYTQREDFFFPYLLPGASGVPTLASPCNLVSDASDQLHVPRLTAILCTLSKSDCLVLITWSPSGYTPVVPECPDVLSSLFTHHSVTVCQSTQGH